MTLDARFDAWRKRIDAALAQSVRSLVDVDGTPTPPRLADAMEHALLAPGKRLRPLLVLACARAASTLDDDTVLALAQPAALAIEHVHAYSLVHDDLPGMDDDDLRRGQPTVHVKFDESTAILAGDALLTNAFAIAARAQHNAARIVEHLALASGSAGMVAGQHDDMRGAAADVDALLRIHSRKTGCLFRAAAVMGALSVDAAGAHVDALSRYGAALGLAFQIGDDVLDVTADTARAGKRLARDASRGKTTFVTLLGVEGARVRANAAADDAIHALATLQLAAPSQSLLASLARFAASRDH